MAEKLYKDQNLPYYMQIKEMLIKQIRSGAIRSNRLPPIRQLAQEFGVSINTVLRAYNELGREGIVTGSVGKGTFIASSPQELNQENRQNLLRKTIDHSLEEALSLGYTVEEFEAAVKDYAKEKLAMLEKVHLSFIECNIEQLTYFTDHLELDPHIQRYPILLEDLKKMNEAMMEKVAKDDIFATSFYHLKEVHEYLDFLGKPIIGINLEPEINTIIEIAKIRQESVVGIVTTSEKFITIIKEILDELNFSFRKLLETNSKNSETVRRLVVQCDAVLVSPKQKKVVDACASDNSKVIEFIFTPDRTSINNLKVAIFDLKKNRV